MRNVVGKVLCLRVIAALVCVTGLAATFEHVLIFVQVFSFLCGSYVAMFVVGVACVCVSPVLRGELKLADFKPKEETYERRFIPGAQPVDLRQKVYSVKHLLDHYGL
jgi:hypothetical protein